MDESSRSSAESEKEFRKAFLTGDLSAPSEHTACHGCKYRRPSPFTVYIPWLLSLILFVCLVVLAIGKKSCVPAGFWKPYELGKSIRSLARVVDITRRYLTIHSSSKEPVKREVPATLKQVRFTAGLKYNESHQLGRIIDPTKPQYVGIPTPEIDVAWRELGADCKQMH